MMQYSFHALTDPGRVRTNNEDAFAVDEARGVAVLADGMGGYNAGEVASGIAISSISSELVKWLSTDARHSSAHIAQAIERCVDKANLSILDAAISNAVSYTHLDVYKRQWQAQNAQSPVA